MIRLIVKLKLDRIAKRIKENRDFSFAYGEELIESIASRRTEANQRKGGRLLFLRTGYHRQRAAAAIELAMMKPGTPLFEVRAPGFRQQQLLGLK